MSEEEISPTANGAEDQVQKRKRLIIILIGAAIVTLIILAIITLSLVLTLGKASCKTVEDIPNHKAIGPIPSQNDRALVRLAGYLELTFENSSLSDTHDTRYVELKLQKVHHSRESNRIYINLITDCGTIELRVYRDSDHARYVLNDIYMRPELSDYPFAECQTVVYNIHFNYAQYFSCHSGLSFACRIPKRDLSRETAENHTRLKRVIIQLNVIDLELDGNPTAIESGRFDLEPKPC